MERGKWLLRTPGWADDQAAASESDGHDDSYPESPPRLSPVPAAAATAPTAAATATLGS